MSNNARQAASVSLLRPPQKRGNLRASSGEGLDKRLYIVSIGLILASILLHQPLFLVGGIILLLILAITDIWARYCLQNVTYQRHLSEQRLFFGEEIVLAISIENTKLLPLPWLELEETFPLTLTIKGHKPQHRLRNNLVTLECLFSLRWYDRVTRRYTIQGHKRGIHKIGPATLYSGDIFGFLRRAAQVPRADYILVYPLVVPLSSFQLPARHPFGDHRAPRRVLEDPTRVIGMRDYVYGDSLRRVDWKATARTMQLQSKIYEATTTYTLSIFLNAATQLDAHYGIHPGLLELSICAAASVTDWAFDQGYAVGLYANTIMHIPDEEVHAGMLKEQDIQAVVAEQLKRRRIRLPASSSQEQRKRIMEALARTQDHLGTSIEEVLRGERAHLTVGSTVIVITSVINEVLTDALILLRRSGNAVTILFVGNNPPPTKLAGITIYHLGGEEVWEAMEAAATHAMNDKTRIVPASFPL